jgi:predicted DNA-binding protein (UPF0251 family)
MKEDDFDIENESENSEVSFEEAEFIRYCDANDLDHDESAMEAEDRQGFVKIKERFIKAIKEKSLVVDGDRLILTVSERSGAMAGKQITVYRPNGRTLLAMDGYKDTQQQVKFSAYMAALCHIPRNEIHKITGLDIKDHQIIQDAATLFLTA